MKNKLFHIITMGCQMNVYDSEQMERLLAAQGYVPTGDMGRADLIVVNTCTIREKPEHKVYSQLGRLVALKRKRQGLVIAVGGCVAKQEGHRIFQRAPHVDIVFGPSDIAKLPGLLAQVQKQRTRLLAVGDESCLEPRMIEPTTYQQGRATAFVTIMTGCDNFCTYCVVPHVRGREHSRKPERIVKEIELLVETGVREVTLLGQNVNSYGKKNGHGAGFPDLLKAVSAVKGLERIRFTTSHPRDLSTDLIRAFAEVKKLAPHIHLPVQSGSDRVLRRMNRRYTRDEYMERVAALRKIRPEISITSDIIVGFPGETAEDFNQTLSIMERVQFDNLFAFKYSDRPEVPAARFSGKLPEETKKERLDALLTMQADVTLRKNKKLVGTVQEVLVEGLSKIGDDQVTGHTPCKRIVNFSDPAAQICQMVPVRIVEGFSHSLLGKMDKSGGGWSDKEGGMLHAA